jgi:signal transduction histidine kinase
MKVSVRAHPQEIEFSVTDDGPGIPPDELASVFERFHRVDSGRSRDEGGSGLGLAIARAIVEAHGGRIWAESAPGAGASLFFVLPRAPQS